MPERLEGSEASTSAKGKGLNMPHRYQGCGGVRRVPFIFG